MPVRQPNPQYLVIGFDETQAAALEPRRIAREIIGTHELAMLSRDVQLAVATEYRALADRRRRAQLAARNTVRGRHAARGESATARRELQELDQFWQGVRLKEPLRTECDIVLVAHMARIRGKLDVPLVVVVHLLDELEWTLSEMANALEDNARHLKRHLERTVL